MIIEQWEWEQGVKQQWVISSSENCVISKYISMVFCFGFSYICSWNFIPFGSKFRLENSSKRNFISHTISFCFCLALIVKSHRCCISPNSHFHCKFVIGASNDKRLIYFMHIECYVVFVCMWIQCRIYYYLFIFNWPNQSEIKSNVSITTIACV